MPPFRGSPGPLAQQQQCPNGYKYDNSKRKCVPKQKTPKSQRCRYQYNKKTKICSVITKGCTLTGYFSQTYKKCIPRCINGQRYDSATDSCR